jgi:CDP-glucose 4,6-dehydratase
VSAPSEPSPDFWKGRRVLVTGATGFVGSHLVAHLVKANADVVVLVRDEVPPTSIVRGWQDAVTRVRGSLEDRSTLSRPLGDYGVQTVFHLAAQSQVRTANRDPIPTLESNVAGTWNILEACRQAAIIEQLVMASSDKAYGDQPVLPYTEETPLDPVNPYDVSKACADLVCRCYARTFGLAAATTRCGNIFGPGDVNWDRLIPGVVRDLLIGRPPVIRSDGKATRDYLYVTDAALAYLRLAEALAADASLAGEAFNFSIERPLSVLELVALLQQAAGTNVEPDVQGRATNEISHQALSAAKARQMLGWAPRIPLEEALGETVGWYRRELGRDG